MTLKPLRPRFVAASPTALQILSDHISKLLQSKDWLYYELHDISRKTYKVSLISQQGQNVRLPAGPDVTADGWLLLRSLSLTAHWVAVDGVYRIVTHDEAPPKDAHS